MINLLSAICAIACFWLLSKTGPNEPAWLPYAIVAMAVVCVVVVGYGFNDSINNPTIDPMADEHRDNAI